MQNKFQQKLNQLTSSNSSFLLFRKPNSSTIELWSDDKDGDFEFIFNRFDDTEKIIFKTNEILECEVEDLSFQFNLKLKNNELNEAISYEKYLQLITKTVQELNTTNTKKIVISRIKEINNNHIDLIKTYINLHQAYPKAYLYLWFTEKNGLWLGASPELLLKEKYLKIETVSLAGTLPKNENWTSKEIHEQQVVTDYIVEKLNAANNLVVDGPHTIDAGFFNHLKSNISANVKEYSEVEIILNQLHPTPAVCGMPKEDAKKFILENEGYDRKFYAGYFGYKSPNESLYFVNLRCAQVFNDLIKLYVGGGIMPDSNPEKEWLETEMKSKTIGNLLNYQ